MMLSLRSLLVLLSISCFSQADATVAKPRTLPFQRTRSLLHYPEKKNHVSVVNVAAALRGGGSASSNPLPAVAPSAASSSTLSFKQHGVVRGGGADIDKSDTWNFADIETKDFVYLGIHVVFLAAVVLVCRTAARTGGLAPSWMSFGEPYATLLLHVAYFGLGALVRFLLPEGLSRIIFSPPSVAILGTVFPAIESIRAAVTDSGSDDRTWLMYWVIHGIFQYSTEFIDQLAEKYEAVYKYWHTFELLAIVWLLLPVTDGATLIYKTIAQPYLVPLVKPIKSFCDGWIATLALTTVNAGYMWWFSFIFMTLPVAIKRYAVMGVGSIFPVASTIMALASTADNSEMKWLTYWSCFSLLNISMIGVEKFVGSFKGLYVVCLAATLYLMLPMFDGSVLIFRKILVPLCGQRELLLLRDARTLAGELFKHVPDDRLEGARQAAADAFLA